MVDDGQLASLLTVHGDFMLVDVDGLLDFAFCPVQSRLAVEG